MGALTKFFSYIHKLTSIFFLKFLPEILRSIILSICILWKSYRRVSSYRKYMSTIKRNSSRFVYRSIQPCVLECRICLSEFAEGDECRGLECGHGFHRNCLEKWLLEYKPSCPLCRRVVVPEETVVEYWRVQAEEEDTGVEKQLALILLSVLHGGSCNGF